MRDRFKETKMYLHFPLFLRTEKAHSISLHSYKEMTSLAGIVDAMAVPCLVRASTIQWSESGSAEYLGLRTRCNPPIVQLLLCLYPLYRGILRPRVTTN